MDSTNETPLYPNLRDFLGGDSTPVPPVSQYPALATQEEKEGAINIVIQGEMPEAQEAVGKDYDYQERFDRKELSVEDIMPTRRPNPNLVRDFKDIAEVGNRDLFYGEGVQFDMTY